jgi:hypothetical protein
VAAHWGLVEALAAELLNRKVLSGPAARKILNEARLGSALDRWRSIVEAEGPADEAR